MDEIIDRTRAVAEHFGLAELFEEVPEELACCAAGEAQ
jgi:hypothetical protein